jgi:tetratricopeptide (TPR) repeat protein
VAVVVDAFDVVVRVDAIDPAAFAARAPNGTFCTDGALARVSFMRASDRDAFVATLEADAGAIARVDPSGAAPDWLEARRYAGVQAVWLKGRSPEPLVVPISWKPDAVHFQSSDEMAEHLEYVETQNNVDVYIDKRTGKKVYAARAPVIDEATGARLEALRAEANALLEPFILSQGKRDLGFFEKRRLAKGIGKLEELLREVPNHWPTLWTLGMTSRVALEHARALEAFRKAYALETANRDVGREYAAQCMICGEGAEAIRVSRALHARFPDDAGLHSNLALAMLVGGDLDEALATARAALARDPKDSITRSLAAFIERVKTGAAKRPRTLPGW